MALKEEVLLQIKKVRKDLVNVHNEYNNKLAKLWDDLGKIIIEIQNEKD